MLESILASKRLELATRQASRPLESLLDAVTATDRDFVAALSNPSPAFILEIKPRSPSAGVLRAPTDLDRTLAAYRQHANAVSVLTDERLFGGSLALLATVRGAVPQPVLCKDFVLDPYQVVEARLHGADAVLLMLSILDDDQYRSCQGAATALRMGILTEVHSEAEMARARALGARVIGINNRRLSDLAVDLATTETLAKQALGEAILIAESGIGRHHDVVRLRPMVDGFLVGTALMAAPDPSRAVRELIFGPTKVCGLTRVEDAELAARLGATHGGLIFTPLSPRRVSIGQADGVRAADQLRWTGVFVDQASRDVAAVAMALRLAAVQLHGEEGPGYVAALRAFLPPGTEIWKAARIRDRIPRVAETGADRVVLDGYLEGIPGGTGRRFDWSLLGSLEDPDDYLLGGGLNPTTAAAAQETGVRFLDVSSGVESTPGHKDSGRLAAFFAARRAARRTIRCDC